MFVKGFFSNYFDINWILWVILVTGVFSIFYPHVETNEASNINLYNKYNNRIFIIVCGIVSGIVIYSQITYLNNLAIFISILSCVILWIVLFNINDNNKKL